MPENKPIKLIIDTNFWISFLISHRQGRSDQLLLIEKVRILFSAELFDEIPVTIKKPKLKKYFGANALDEMLLNLEAYIDLTEVESPVNIYRDLKDNFCPD